MSSPSYLQGAAGRRAFIKLLAATPLFATMATQSFAKSVAAGVGKATTSAVVTAITGIVIATAIITFMCQVLGV